MDLVEHSQEPIGILSQLVSLLFSDVLQHMTEHECNYNEKVYVKCQLMALLNSMECSFLPFTVHIDVFSFKQES